MSHELRDDLYLRDIDYIAVTAPDLYYEAAVIFGFIGLRPVKYQLGHQFFDIDERKKFVAFEEETLTRAVFFLGLRCFWLPTMDEIVRQAYVDGIRVSFSFGGETGKQAYRTVVHDPYFTKDGSSAFPYLSYDPWFALAVPVARTYKRRFEEYGLQTVEYPLYSGMQAFVDHPLSVTDQSTELMPSATDTELLP